MRYERDKTGYDDNHDDDETIKRKKKEEEYLWADEKLGEN